jgi:hypothetical protein
MSLVPFDPSVHKFEKGKVFYELVDGKGFPVKEFLIWENGDISIKDFNDNIYPHTFKSQLSIEVPDPVKEVRYVGSTDLYKVSWEYKVDNDEIELTFLDGKFHSAKPLP